MIHKFKVLKPLIIDLGKGRENFKFGDTIEISDGVEKSIYDNLMRFRRHNFIEYLINVIVGNSNVKAEPKKEVQKEIKSEKIEIPKEIKKRGRPSKKKK